ncbi:unnamed protein product [Closterium sp. NIES-65]|nr:unnamed protein product [Closterium sp. NIES-65]
MASQQGDTDYGDGDKYGVQDMLLCKALAAKLQGQSPSAPTNPSPLERRQSSSRNPSWKAGAGGSSKGGAGGGGGEGAGGVGGGKGGADEGMGRADSAPEASAFSVSQDSSTRPTAEAAGGGGGGGAGGARVSAQAPVSPGRGGIDLPRSPTSAASPGGGSDSQGDLLNQLLQQKQQQMRQQGGGGGGGTGAFGGSQPRQMGGKQAQSSSSGAGIGAGGSSSGAKGGKGGMSVEEKVLAELVAAAAAGKGKMGEAWGSILAQAQADLGNIELSDSLGAEGGGRGGVGGGGNGRGEDMQEGSRGGGGGEMEVDGKGRGTGASGGGALEESAQSRPGTGQSRGGGAAAAAGGGAGGAAGGVGGRQATSEKNIFNLQASAVNDLLEGINIAGFGLNLDTLEFDTSESGQSSSVCMSPATAAEVSGSRAKLSSAMSPAGAAAAGSSQNIFAGMTSRSLNSLSLKKNTPVGASGSRSGIDAKGGGVTLGGGVLGGPLAGRASSLNAAPSRTSLQDPNGVPLGAGSNGEPLGAGGSAAGGAAGGGGGGGGGGSGKEKAQGRPAGWHVGLELLPLDTPIGDMPSTEVFENSGKRSRVALSHIRTSSGSSSLPESEQKQLLEFARSSGVLGNSPGGPGGGGGTPGGGAAGLAGGSNCSSARTLSPALSTDSGRSGGGESPGGFTSSGGSPGDGFANSVFEGGGSGGSGSGSSKPGRSPQLPGNSAGQGGRGRSGERGGRGAGAGGAGGVGMGSRDGSRERVRSESPLRGESPIRGRSPLRGESPCRKRAWGSDVGEGESDRDEVMGQGDEAQGGGEAGGGRRGPGGGVGGSSGQASGANSGGGGRARRGAGGKKGGAGAGGGTSSAGAAVGGGSGGAQGEASGGEAKKQRQKRGTATDPHSVAARLRRDRISQRMRALYDLVPNARNTDTASMLDEAIQYVRSLQEQVQTLKKEKGESQGTSSVGTGSLGRPADSNNEGGEGGTSRSAGQQSMGQSMAQSMGQNLAQAGYGGTEDGFGSENEVWDGSAAPSPMGSGMGSGMGSRKGSMQLLAEQQGSGEFGGVGRVGDGKVEGGLRGVGLGVEGYMKAEPENDDFAEVQELELEQQQQQQQQQHSSHNHHSHHAHALAPSGSDVGVTGAAAGLSLLVATAAVAPAHGSALAGATGVLAAGGLVDGAKGSNHGALVTEAGGVAGLETMIVGGAEVEWPSEIELTLEDMNMVDLGGWDFDS